MRRTLLRAALATSALSLASLAVVTSPSMAAAVTSASPCGTISVTDGNAHAITHVVWVVFENKSRSQVFADPTVDPYLTGLAQQCGQADAYQSLPANAAKLAMTSGTDWGVTSDATPEPGPDLYSQLGSNWRQYMGGMPGNCWPTDTLTDTYVSRHNPAVFYTDNAAACATQDLPLPATPADLDLSAAFTWIEADVPDSMHGCAIGCPPTSAGRLAAGDAWASDWVQGVIDSPEYAAGTTAIFVVWDEGGGAAGTTPDNAAFLVISPYTTPGFVSDVAYSHYSLLRGTEDLLSLPALAHAGDPTTTSVATDFGLPYPPVAATPPPPPPPPPGGWTATPLPPVVNPGP